MSDSKEILPDVNNIKSSESYTLPSKGLIYKPADKIPQSITLRRMTTREDKIRRRNSNENVIKKEILQACIVNEGVDVSKLSLVDANFLYFKLRIISLLTDTYKVRCICPHCGADFIHEINLSEVPITYLTKDKLNLMSVTLPLSKQKVDLKIPTLGNIIKFQEDFVEYINQFPDADRAEYIFSSSQSMHIDKVNGKKLMSIESEDWYNNLDIVDSRSLSEAIDNITDIFGYVEKIEAQCPSCQKPVLHGLPITSELFTPSR